MSLKPREDRMLMPDEAKALRDQIALLREALAPFAKVAEATHESETSLELEEDDYISVYYEDIRVRHFRKAAAVLEATHAP